MVLSAHTLPEQIFVYERIMCMGRLCGTCMGIVAVFLLLPPSLPLLLLIFYRVFRVYKNFCSMDVPRTYFRHHLQWHFIFTYNFHRNDPPSTLFFAAAAVVATTTSLIITRQIKLKRVMHFRNAAQLTGRCYFMAIPIANIFNIRIPFVVICMPPFGCFISAHFPEIHFSSVSLFSDKKKYSYIACIPFFFVPRFISLLIWLDYARTKPTFDSLLIFLLLICFIRV